MKLWLKVLLHGRIMKDRDGFAGVPVKNVSTAHEIVQWWQPFIRDFHTHGWRPVQVVTTGQYWKLDGKWWQRVYRLPFGYSIYVKAPTK